MTTKPRKSTTRPMQVEKPAPGQRADHQQPTSASGWKKSAQTLTLPSGNVMRVKNPGIMELANKGLIPNALMNVILEAIRKGQQPKPEDILTDKIEISDMFEMMDSAILDMAVDPPVWALPVWTQQDFEEGKCPQDEVGNVANSKKLDDALYINDISEEDKMFIWNWATGGTTDLTQFRKESASLLASIPGQPVVAENPQRDPQD